jgi:hypothetical protein
MKDKVIQEYRLLDIEDKFFLFNRFGHDFMGGL